jgi:hypothetical protein
VEQIWEQMQAALLAHNKGAHRDAVADWKRIKEEAGRRNPNRGGNIMKPFSNSSTTAMPSANNTSDTTTQLERLAALHRQGALSDTEFVAAKSKALGFTSTTPITVAAPLEMSRTVLRGSQNQYVSRTVLHERDWAPPFDTRPGYNTSDGPSGKQIFFGKNFKIRQHLLNNELERLMVDGVLTIYMPLSCLACCCSGACTNCLCCNHYCVEGSSNITFDDRTRKLTVNTREERPNIFKWLPCGLGLYNKQWVGNYDSVLRFDVEPVYKRREGLYHYSYAVKMVVRDDTGGGVEEFCFGLESLFEIQLATRNFNSFMQARRNTRMTT